MDSGAQKLLESATHRTLHAHNFSRTSSQASLVLTDLFSRYLTLLSETCAKYAEHAGRKRLAASDALSALDELGVSVEELSEYYKSEGYELNRYAVKSQRRWEDLNEFRAHLAEGLRQDHDDAIPLEYRPFDPSTLEEEEEEKEENEGEGEEQEEIAANSEEDAEGSDEDIVMDDGDTNILNGVSSVKHGLPMQPSSPPLPLSPISNPSSPHRKRPRTSDWQPPDHIPDFLPPFPSSTIPSEPATPALSPPGESLLPPPLPVEDVKIDKPPAENEQAVTSAAASDFLVQVPYSQSSLASTPEWHLPTKPDSTALVSAKRGSKYPIPRGDQPMIGAFHYILTNPQINDNTSVASPARHNVAMALLELTERSSRWDPPDTLYSNVAPNQPRVSAIGPTFAVAEGGKVTGAGFPQSFRTAYSSETMTYLVSQQGSRITELARHVLPGTILHRTSQLTHPGALSRGTKPLIYGEGVPAYWNRYADAAAAAKDGVNGVSSKDSKEKVVLPDARMYATWDYERKDFKAPLHVHHAQGTRTRIGSVQGGGPKLSLKPPGRRQSKV